MRTRAERYVALTIFKLGNGFARLYTTAVAILTVCEYDKLILFLLLLESLLISPGAVTPPPARSPIPASREVPPQYQQQGSPNDRDDDTGDHNFETNRQ